MWCWTLFSTNCRNSVWGLFFFSPNWILIQFKIHLKESREKTHKYTFKTFLRKTWPFFRHYFHAILFDKKFKRSIEFTKHFVCFDRAEWRRVRKRIHILWLAVAVPKRIVTPQKQRGNFAALHGNEWIFRSFFLSLHIRYVAHLWVL